MSQIIDDLRAENGQARITRCAERRCSLDLRGVAADNHVIVSPEQILSGTSQSRCDCIVFCDRDGLWVVPVELKGGGYDAGQVIAQLQSGAQIAENLLRARACKGFIPLLLCGRGSSAGIRVLRKDQSRVSFRGRTYFIEIRNCGFPLTQVLSE